MTHRERFVNLFTGKPVDRMPLYFFGTWRETKERWANEGFPGEIDFGPDGGPQVPGMDPDWEVGLWNVQGLVWTGAIGDEKEEILDEDAHTRTVRNHLGRIDRLSKNGSSLPETLRYPLKGTRESWEKFRPFLDPNRINRYPADWRERAAKLNAEDRVTTFMGGSFYGWLRDFMGVEELSYLMLDDPDLLREMVETITDHFITLTEPILEATRFEFVYFWEDCCSATAPLYSPKIYREIFDPYYKKLIAFYKSHGVPLALIDSDGRVDQLVPCFKESGFDIIFPLEVGTWKATPDAMRESFGKDLKIMGGVDKFYMARSEDELRQYLLTLVPAVKAGGFLPMPDHRVPPEVDWAHMQSYVRIFREVFA